jgi:hypothetical protein
MDHVIIGLGVSHFAAPHFIKIVEYAFYYLDLLQRRTIAVHLQPNVTADAFNFLDAGHALQFGILVFGYQECTI